MITGAVAAAAALAVLAAGAHHVRALRRARSSIDPAPAAVWSVAAAVAGAAQLAQGDVVAAVLPEAVAVAAAVVAVAAVRARWIRPAGAGSSRITVAAAVAVVAALVVWQLTRSAAAALAVATGASALCAVGAGIAAWREPRGAAWPWAAVAWAGGVTALTVPAAAAGFGISVAAAGAMVAGTLLLRRSRAAVPAPPVPVRAGVGDRAPVGADPGGPATPERRRRDPAGVAATVFVLGAIGAIALLAVELLAPVPTTARITPVAPPLALGVAPAPARVADAPRLPPHAAGTVTLGVGTPGFVALAPDGVTAWVAHGAARMITVVDTRTGRVGTPFPVPAGPAARFLTFCHGRAWVSVSSDTDRTQVPLISMIDMTTHAQLGVIRVGRRPMTSGCSPDGTRLVVPSHDDARLDVIDTSGTEARAVPSAANPHWAAFTGDGRVLAVADHESSVLTLFDPATMAERVRIPVGRGPHAVAISPDGRTAAVACYDGGELDLVDLASARVVARVPVGAGPQAAAWTPDGRRVLTADNEADQVSVVDVAARAVTARIPTDSPTTFAMAPDGRRAWVTNYDAGTLTELALS